MVADKKQIKNSPVYPIVKNSIKKALTKLRPFKNKQKLYRIDSKIFLNLFFNQFFSHLTVISRYSNVINTVCEITDIYR